MKRGARLWTGVTILAVILINYALIGAPLLSKARSIQARAKAILTRQAGSTGIFNNSEDEYILDVFRKEKSAIDTKITILNSVAATLALLAASWTIFGLMLGRKSL